MNSLLVLLGTPVAVLMLVEAWWSAERIREREQELVEERGLR